MSRNTFKMAAPPKKKKALPKKMVAAAPREKEPEYMVHITDPKMLRKDILESLREIIIFMQGYEPFRKIQEEKVALFAALRAKVREINNVVDNKLRRHFPKGQLKPAGLRHREEQLSMEDDARLQQPQEAAPAQELDTLEAELREIEGKLGSVG